MNIMSEAISFTLSIIGEGAVVSRMPLIRVASLSRLNFQWFKVLTAGKLYDQEMIRHF